MPTSHATTDRVVLAASNTTEQSILARFLDFAESLRNNLLADPSDYPTAAISRIRGTGPGVSFGRLVDELEVTHPITMNRPFEGTASIAGGVWDTPNTAGQDDTRGLVKLHFDAGTNTLPMHSHEHSDRVIFVLEGRGFFHVSDQALDEFDGTDIRSVPVRSRDALVFSRGVVHTFSCPDEPLVLLSYHHPFFPLDDPRQYTVPSCRITPAEFSHTPGHVSCDPAWNVLVGGPTHLSRD